MKQGKSKRLALGLGIVCIAILLSRLFSGTLDSLDQGVTSMKYRVRGESRIDSSIVILYLSGDDIASLGGIPLKRSYYALILDVLRDLGAKAVGVDVAFTEADQEHAEYDEILSTVVRGSGNVVLGGYFRALSAADSGATRLPHDFKYQAEQTAPFPSGAGLELPFGQLLGSATPETTSGTHPICRRPWGPGCPVATCPPK